MPADQNKKNGYKNKKNIKTRIIGILVILVIIIGTVTISHFSSLEPEIEYPEIKQGAYLEIGNSSNFTDYGLLGNGSLENPYIIENLTISNYEQGISIWNIIENVTIRNCIMTNNIVGIYIHGVESSVIKIFNCTIESQWQLSDGIELWSSNEQIAGNIILINNTIDVDNNALKIPGGRRSKVNSTILENQFINGYISVAGQVNARIYNNIFVQGGVSTYLTPYIHIENNSFENGTIFVSDSDLIEIRNNSFIRGGISFFYIKENQLENCIVEYNYVNKREIKIFRNLNNTEIIDMNFGEIILFDCENTKIKDNSITHASVGISIHHSKNITLENNQLTENYEYGIVLLDSDSCEIINNEFKFCERVGIVLQNTNNTQIVNNTFIENKCHGIYLVNSFDCLIYNNHFIDNNIVCKKQAYDSNGNNYWYNPGTKKGNYWSDWSGIGSYRINNYKEHPKDLYPLRNSPYGKRKMCLGEWMAITLLPPIMLIAYFRRMRIINKFGKQ